MQKKSQPLPFDFPSDPQTPNNSAITYSVALRSGLLREPPEWADWFPPPPASSFFFFFFFGPGSLILPLLALLGTSWHQFWLQISWVARLHHVKIAISLHLCRAIFKGSKVWRSRLAAWQAQPMDTSTRESGRFALTALSTGNKRNGRGKSANVFLHIVGIWPQDQQKYI